jgi:endonuclease/exonuclease/phosphatase family metal-dependent hydrolase
MRKSVAVLVAVAAGLIGLVLGDTGRSEAEPVPAAAVVPLKVITWNICGEYSGCPKIANATEMTAKRDAVRKLVDAQQADAILLEETCEWYASTVLQRLNEAAGSTLWHMSFSGARQYDDGSANPSHTAWYGRRTRTCSNERWKSLIEPDVTDQALGVAVLTKGPHDETTAYELPSPTEQYSTTAPLLCVRKTSTPAAPDDAVRLCVSHFTAPGVAGSEQLRDAQAKRVAAIVTSFGTDRVVVGGDLNTYPPDGGTQRSDLLTPLYDRMRECAMVDEQRRGPETARWAGGSGKLDYLFARSGGSGDASLVAACTTQKVDAVSQPFSDHAPIIGTFAL